MQDGDRVVPSERQKRGPQRVEKETHVAGWRVGLGKCGRGLEAKMGVCWWLQGPRLARGSVTAAASLMVGQERLSPRRGSCCPDDPALPSPLRPPLPSPQTTVTSSIAQGSLVPVPPA